MEELSLPTLAKSTSPTSIQPTTNSSSVNNYLQFIDDSNIFIKGYSSDLEGEILAQGRDGDRPVSMAFSRYRDRGGHIRKIPGSVLYLPRPSSFAVNLIGIVEALVKIGIEKSPRGYSDSQKRLDEFHHSSTTGEETVDYIIDDQLASRCLEKYRRGEYNDAVSTAGRLLEQRVKEVAPDEFSEQTGRELMTSAFNKSNGPLRFANRDDEQEGIMFLYAGAIGGIRNIAVHRPEGGEDFIHNFDKEMTRSIIFYIDYLLKLLDRFKNSQS